MDEPSFAESDFGKALTDADYLKYSETTAMTRDNITQVEEMALNQIASDDKILRLVSDHGPTSNAAPEKREPMTLGEVLKNVQASENDKFQQAFYETLKNNPRFTNLEISDCVDYAATDVSQVSSKTYHSYTKMATFRLSGDGTRYVTYAGTGSEIASWLEDGRMATTRSGVKAQQAAAEYLQKVMDRYEEDQFAVAGYSKGGNEALYACTMLNEEDWDRLQKITNFDGPGFGKEILNNAEFKKRYNDFQERMDGKLDCFSPQNSIVGHLMENHKNYVYFESCNGSLQAGAMAHDYKFWSFNSAGGKLVTTDADGNPLQRTGLSEFYESTMEDLLDALTPEQTERFFDMLEGFCNDHEIVGIWQLNKLWTQDGKFDLGTAIGSIWDFVSSLDDDDRTILQTIVNTLITADHMAQLEGYILDYAAESGMTEEEKAKWKTELNYVLLGKSIENATDEEVRENLKQLVIQLVVAAAAKAIVNWVCKTANELGDKVHLKVSDLNSKIQSHLEEIWSETEQFIQQVQQKLKENPICQKIGSALEVCIEPFKKLLEKGRDVIVDAADTIGQTVQQILSKALNGIIKGGQAGASCINSFFDGCLRLFRNAQVYVSRKIGFLSSWYASGGVLSIDESGLTQTIQLLRWAAQTATGLGARVSYIGARMAAEGVVDAVTGDFTNFANLYHIKTARMQVNHAAEIYSMAMKLEKVRSSYETALQSIRTAMQETNG